MEYKVIKEFQDKKTKKIHVTGSKYECDQKRANELIKLGFLKGESQDKQEKDGAKAEEKDGDKQEKDGDKQEKDGE